MKSTFCRHAIALTLGLVVATLSTSIGAQTAEPSAYLFTNVRVFDGQSAELSTVTSVLVVGNKISKIGDSLELPRDTISIAGAGRTLMPGLIDNHWHALFAAIPQTKLLASDIAYINLVAGQEAKRTLLRGFTSVRDVGGNVFGLKKAIDEGILIGPRIYPSGPYISQTSGHGDFRGSNDVPAQSGRELSYFERNGMTLIADGKPEVIKRTREALRMGATQIKVMAGGGVSSFYDPLDVRQYTLDEMKAIVDVAASWNTYVTVHAFTDDSIVQAVEAGVKCIEHGHLMRESTVKLLADKNVWLSMQPILDDDDAIPFPEGSPNQLKYLAVANGTDAIYKLARKHGVQLAWGTDTLFDQELARKQGKQLAKMQRWFNGHDILTMATHDNAQLLKLCGPRDPYPGQIGGIRPGALADLILVNGNPLDEIGLVADPDKNFDLIMKDGIIYKQFDR